MAHDDDDLMTAPVPPPDAEVSASERARAGRFAELVDKALVGRTPPAMNADDRALLEVATGIRAARGVAGELPAERRHAIVEDALRQALGGAGGPQSEPGRARGGRPRWAPWAAAGGAALAVAAAVAVVWLRRPAPAASPGAPAAALPATWRSRPADPLIGPIARDRVADASARIDTIFADRLDGYRERTLARRTR